MIYLVHIANKLVQSLIIVLLLWITALLPGNSNADSQSFALRYGGPGLDSSGNVVEARDGSIYLTLDSSPPLVPGKQRETTSILRKLDQTGRILWERKFGGERVCQEALVALAVDESLYVSMWCSEGITGVPPKDTAFIRFKSGGHSLLKFSPNGDVLWQVFYSGISVSTMIGDAEEGVYLGGSMLGPVIFAGQSILHKPANDLVLARVSKSGVLQWIRIAGAPSSPFSSAVDGISAMRAAPGGGIFVAGVIGGSSSLPGKKQDVTIKTQSGPDAFVAAVSPDGFFSWATHFPAEGYGSAEQLEVMPDGSLLVAGYFESKIELSSKLQVKSNGGKDLFLAQLGADGEVKGLRSSGDSLDNTFVRIGVAQTGEIYLSGFQPDFGDADPTSPVTRKFQFSYGPLLLALSPRLELRWWIQFAGVGNRSVQEIVPTRNGNILLLGEFTGMLDADPSPLVHSLEALPGNNFSEEFDVSLIRLNERGQFEVAQSP